MIRAGILLRIDEVLPNVQLRREKGTPVKEVNFYGHDIKMNSIRYKVFAEKGIKCVTCGIEGKYFAIEKHCNKNGKGRNNKNRHHLNLYALDKNKQEVLMTVDHTIPASKGGKRVLENLEPMCTHCNREKGDKIVC